MDGKEKRCQCGVSYVTSVQFAGYIESIIACGSGLAVWGQMEACVFGALISALLNLQSCVKVLLEAVGIAGAFKSL